MYEHSNRMESVNDVQGMISGLVSRIQTLRHEVARLIHLMQKAGELPEEKAESLRGLIVGPLEEQEPDSAADMTNTALSGAGVEAPLGSASGDVRPRASFRRRTTRIAHGPGAQDPEYGGGQA